jgi:hypothetical protein
MQDLRHKPIPNCEGTPVKTGDEIDKGDSMPKIFKAIPIRIEACFKCQRPLLFSFSGNLKKNIP